MKKTSIVVLALALVGGAVFAQGEPTIKITGQLQTGLRDVVTINGAVVTDAVSLYDAETGNPARFRIGLSFTSPDGNWGVTTRLDAGSNPVVLPLYASWNRALVWGSLFNRILTLKAGILDEEGFSFTWRPWGAEYVWGGQIDGELGLEAIVQPVPGLMVGYVFPIADGLTCLDSLRGSTIGISYALPDFIRVVAGAKLTKQTDIILGVTTGVSFAWAGIDFTAVKNLTARLAAQGLGIGSAYPWLQLYEEAGYAIDALGVNLKCWEEMYTVANSGFGWQVEPTATYKLGLITIGVMGDLGNLLQLDPNPGVSPLPFGFAAGAFASYALAPTAAMKIAVRYLMPDISAAVSALQTSVSFAWAF
jgi:hypothetical protein